jgi:hypothetical protein
MGIYVMAMHPYKVGFLRGGIGRFLVCEYTNPTSLRFELLWRKHPSSPRLEISLIHCRVGVVAVVERRQGGRRHLTQVSGENAYVLGRVKTSLRMA